MRDKPFSKYQILSNVIMILWTIIIIMPFLLLLLSSCVWLYPAVRRQDPAGIRGQHPGDCDRNSDQCGTFCFDGVSIVG